MTYYLIDEPLTDEPFTRYRPLLITQCSALIAATLQPHHRLRRHVGPSPNDWIVIEPSNSFCRRIFPAPSEPPPPPPKTPAKAPGLDFFDWLHTGAAPELTAPRPARTST